MKNNVKTTEQNKLNSFQRAASRQEFIAQNANDGRYKSRIVPDKKKEAKKNGWM